MKHPMLMAGKRLARHIVIGLLALSLALSVGAVAEYRTLTLPKALKSIETEAFYNDQDVRNVVVPEGVTRIGARAFVGSGLRMIQLPASVTAIDGDPFDGADSVVVVAKKGTYACQWAETHGYTVSQEAQRWDVDQEAWTQTTERKSVVLCQGCGRYFFTFDDYQAHAKRIMLAKQQGDTQAIYEETAGGLPTTVSGLPREPDRTGSGCGAHGGVYLSIPLDEPIYHPEEGHYRILQ